MCHIARNIFLSVGYIRRVIRCLDFTTKRYSIFGDIAVKMSHYVYNILSVVHSTVDMLVKKRNVTSLHFQNYGTRLLICISWIFFWRISRLEMRDTSATELFCIRGKRFRHRVVSSYAPKRVVVCYVAPRIMLGFVFVLGFIDMYHFAFARYSLYVVFIHVRWQVQTILWSNKKKVRMGKM